MWEIMVEIVPNVTEEERKVGMSTKERDEPLTRVNLRPDEVVAVPEQSLTNGGSLVSFIAT